ncbi:MAG: hypothetical protein U0941_00520 [Planctomycetaceae bacterium]
MQLSKARELIVRGKSVKIHEIPDLFAVQSQHGVAQMSSKAIGKPRSGVSNEVSCVLNAVPSIEPQEVAAFTDAGWSFVPKRLNLQLESATGISKVFVNQCGHLVLGTNRLSVKVRPETSSPEIEKVFARYRVRILQQLKFASGLYQVAIDSDSDRDAIDVAGELSADPVIEFAEPEFIEFVGHR